MTVRYPSNAG